MQESDVIERILYLCRCRNWTLYRLAKESDITYSTLCTMLRKGNSPSLSTLIKLCNGFGISLSQFFDEDERIARLTKEQLELLEKWTKLSRKDQATATRFLDFLLQNSMTPAGK